MKCVGEDGFSFLPCPVPDDSGDHFKSSQGVYKFFDNGLLKKLFKLHLNYSIIAC